MLAVLFARPEDRPLLAALVLLNAELARIPEVVSEPMAGMIRYQWWRDALDRAGRGEGLTQHPLLAPVARALADGRLVQAELGALIDAREAELDRLQPAALDDLETYAEATSGHLHRLLALAVAADDRAVAAATHVGVGFALVGIVRAIGFHRAQGRVLLPAELLEAQAVTTAEILEAGNDEALARVTQAITARAETRLARASALGPFARRVMPALLPARLARRQARRIATRGHAALAEPSRGAWTVPDLAWHWLRCRI